MYNKSQLYNTLINSLNTKIHSDNLVLIFQKWHSNVLMK